jgi:hypothetical protein
MLPVSVPSWRRGRERSSDWIFNSKHGFRVFEMQLIVLGMHRSGTSVLARLLNMMGAYFAAEGLGIGANPENPKGF